MSGALLAAIMAALACVLAAGAVRNVRRWSLLVRAGLPERDPAEGGPSRDSSFAVRAAWLARPLAVAAGLGIGSVVAGGPGALAGFAASLALPAAIRRRRAARREERMESQLAEAVATIAAGLRAGLSLAQAIRFAADEGEPPLAPSLREVVDRATLGIPLAESLDRWASEESVPDVRFVVGVLRLHHRTGGDLPAVLDQLARTLRERRAAGREIRSLTAQARLSGAIIGFLPLGFFLFLSATSRQDIAAAYHSPTGSMAIAVGLGLQAGAFLWIRRLLRVTP